MESLSHLFRYSFELRGLIWLWCRPPQNTLPARAYTRCHDHVPPLATPPPLPPFHSMALPMGIVILAASANEAYMCTLYCGWRLNFLINSLKHTKNRRKRIRLASHGGGGSQSENYGNNPCHGFLLPVLLPHLPSPLQITEMQGVLWRTERGKGKGAAHLTLSNNCLRKIRKTLKKTPHSSRFLYSHQRQIL